MSLDLENLFQQIIDSEQQVHSRLISVCEAKKQNAECLSNLKLMNTDVLSYCGNLDLQTRKLVEVTTRNDWTLNKIMILERQRTVLISKREKLTDELEATRARISHGRECFLKETEEFDIKYDLNGCSAQLKETSALVNIRQIRDDLSDLNKELCRLQEASTKDEDQYRRSTCPTVDQDRDCPDWKSRSALEEQLIKKLEVEKDRVSCVPMQDDEFTRLSAELEDLRNCASLESRCISLRHEFQKLQQQSRWQY